MPDMDVHDMTCGGTHIGLPDRCASWHKGSEQRLWRSHDHPSPFGLLSSGSKLDRREGLKQDANGCFSFSTSNVTSRAVARALPEGEMPFARSPCALL